jgi:hypothetical protein
MDAPFGGVLNWWRRCSGAPTDLKSGHSPPLKLGHCPPFRRFGLRRHIDWCFVVTAVEERRVKVLLKEAVVEVLEERHDLLREALQSSLEDVAMLKAIQQGEKPRLTSRSKIFQRLTAPNARLFDDRNIFTRETPAGLDCDYLFLRFCGKLLPMCVNLV